MTLITANGERADTFTRVEDRDGLASVPAGSAPLVALALLSPGSEGEPAEIDAAALPAGFGLSVPNDAAIATIEPYLERAALIAVDFPAFSDGRGLSMAMRLRRAGFAGTLRASGPLIADQFADALACGFDEVDLPQTMANRQPVQQWLAARQTMSVHYQRGYGSDGSILRQRMAAREVEGAGS